MKQFTKRFDDRLQGVLSGFARLRFRGTLLLLTSEGGMSEFLWRNQILLKDFKDDVFPLTERGWRTGERLAANTPLGKVHSLPSTHISRDRDVQALIEQVPQHRGLIAVLSCGEACLLTSARMRL